MYNSVSELLKEAKEKNSTLWNVILEEEQRCKGTTVDDIFAELERRYEIMKESTERATDRKREALRKSLITGMAATQKNYAMGHQSICGDFMNLVMARALSCSECNAAMGRICAAPTAGACGILPAVLVSLEERYQCPKRKMLEALLVASGIGTVIVKNATVSGAEGGCQAECGVAAAIASAAAVYLAGGDNKMQTEAVALALINVMGLICDPVAGLVQIPCAQRNASQSVNALLSADLALSGNISFIPADEVIEAMYKSGKMLPSELKETALGGIAVTETGKAIAEAAMISSEKVSC